LTAPKKPEYDGPFWSPPIHDWLATDCTALA
jgi:hypothetical protein